MTANHHDDSGIIHENHIHLPISIIVIAIILELCLIAGVVYLGLENKKMVSTISNQNIQLTQRTSEINQLQTDINNRTEMLEKISEDNSALQEFLEKEQDKNDRFEDQIENLSETVGVLDKLQKTDPQLLQKYSKVYFLNEHYAPSSLRAISDRYIAGDKDIQIHSDVWPFLKDLLDDAEEDGINLRVISGFRSFETQSSLKSQYKTIYGSGANAFSADQGFSEHQLGTTVDFSTEELGTNFGAIDTTEAFDWLENNAHRFGFTLSYPKGNAYYVYEPWHWRFVGRELARDLDRKGDGFYDLEQREINEYLIELFD